MVIVFWIELTHDFFFNLLYVKPNLTQYFTYWLHLYDIKVYRLWKILELVDYWILQFWFCIHSEYSFRFENSHHQFTLINYGGRLSRISVTSRGWHILRCSYLTHHSRCFSQVVKSFRQNKTAITGCNVPFRFLDANPNLLICCWALKPNPIFSKVQQLKRYVMTYACWKYDFWTVFTHQPPYCCIASSKLISGASWCGKSYSSSAQTFLYGIHIIQSLPDFFKPQSKVPSFLTLFLSSWWMYSLWPGFSQHFGFGNGSASTACWGQALPRILLLQILLRCSLSQKVLLQNFCPNCINQWLAKMLWISVSVNSGSPFSSTIQSHRILANASFFSWLACILCDGSWIIHNFNMGFKFAKLTAHHNFYGYLFRCNLQKCLL